MKMKSTFEHTQEGKWTSSRFLFLLFALIILLLGCSYMPNNQLGAFLGGMMSLLLPVTAIFIALFVALLTGMYNQRKRT